MNAKTKQQHQAETTMVAVKSIRPSKNNPRTSRDPEKQKELELSVASKGILQPLLVRPATTGYEVVCGHGRLEAAKKAKLNLVPCMVREMDDQEAYDCAVAENLVRSDMNPLDEADAVADMVMRLGAVGAALATGRTVPQVMRLSLLRDYPKSVRELVRSGKISLGHARELAEIRNEDVLEKLAKLCDTQRLTIDELRKKIRENQHAIDKAKFDLDECYQNERGCALVKCLHCPQRSDKQTDLFGTASEEGPALCLNPECWEEKRVAHRELVLERLRTEGKDAQTGNVSYSWQWIQDDDKTHADEIAKAKAAGERQTYIVDQDGIAHPRWDRETLRKYEHDEGEDNESTDNLAPRKEADRQRENKIRSISGQIIADRFAEHLLEGDDLFYAVLADVLWNEIGHSSDALNDLFAEDENGEIKHLRDREDKWPSVKALKQKIAQKVADYIDPTEMDLQRIGITREEATQKATERYDRNQHEDAE